MFLKTFIIIPAYNEIENIEKLTEAIFSLGIGNLEIIIVDDNSTDGTGKAIRELDGKFNKLKYILRQGKRSFAQSYMDGFRAALKGGAEYIIQMDADFSHNPLHLPEIIDNLKESDVVVGSRYVKGGKIVNWSLKRRLISKGGNLFARLAAGVKINDLTSGFVGWQRPALERIISRSIKADGYAFQIELKCSAHRDKARIKEIPIVFADREGGKSKMNRKIILEAIRFCLKMAAKNIFKMNYAS